MKGPTTHRARAAAQLTAVTRRFGSKVALDQVSFSVPTGSLCALVGENGAGKTTTLSILAGFLPPHAGAVDVLGLGPYQVSRHRGRVGVLPQDAELPLQSSPRQLLVAWARLQGLDARGARAAAERALDEVLLGDRADDPVKALSHGMRRRLTVASALLGDPELVLLDEPTSGLDPAQSRHLREVLAARRGRGTVLVSSHNLPELESMCDHVIVLQRGQCITDASMESVTGRDREVTVSLAAPLPPGRGATVRLLLAPSDPRPLAVATSALIAELLAEGATIEEVRRGGALAERYFAPTPGGDAPR